MKLVKWGPGAVDRPWFALQREMNQLFDDFLPRSFREVGEWTPALDVSETDNAFIVKAELPGIAPEDVEISLTGDLLTIKGEKKEEKEEKAKSYHRVERSYGCFERSLRLPAAIETEKVAASFKSGVLTIELPKSAQSKTRTVKVKAE